MKYKTLLGAVFIVALVLTACAPATPTTLPTLPPATEPAMTETTEPAMTETGEATEPATTDTPAADETATGGIPVTGEATVQVAAPYPVPERVVGRPVSGLHFVIDVDDLVAVALADDLAVIARLAVQVDFVHGDAGDLACVLLGGTWEIWANRQARQRQTADLEKSTPG